MRNVSVKLFGLLLVLTVAASCGPSLEYSTKAKPYDPSAPEDTLPVGPETPDKPDAPTFESNGELRVVMVDVGQGDGLVVISPSGKTVIIDTGVKEGGSAIVDLLRSEGISTVDLMVFTHPHADHIGGATTVINELEVARILDPGTTHESATYRKLFETIEKKNIPVLIATRGRKIKVDENVEFTILAPFDDHLTGTRSDLNANSIVMRLTYGNVSVIFTGDAEAETEEGLIEHNSAETPLRSTVLKVAHHGSAYASTQGFLELVTPKAAMISCGKGNTYGHPNEDTMRRISAYTRHIFRTDEQGSVSLITDGNTLRIAPTRGEAVSVDIR